MKTITQSEAPVDRALFQVRDMDVLASQRIKAFAAARGKRIADVLADAINEYLEKHPIDVKAVRRAS